MSTADSTHHEVPGSHAGWTARGETSIRVEPEAIEILRSQFQRLSAAFEVGLLLGIRNSDPETLTIQNCIPQARGYSSRGLDQQIQACLSQFIGMKQPTIDAGMSVLGYYCLQKDGSARPELSGSASTEDSPGAPTTVAITIALADSKRANMDMLLHPSGTLVCSEALPWVTEFDIDAPARQTPEPDVSDWLKSRTMALVQAGQGIRWPIWIGTALIVLLLIGAGAWFKHAASRQPKVVEKSAAAPSVVNLPLHAEWEGTEISLSWDQKLGPGPQTITIRDGSARKSYELSATEQERRSFRYTPTSNDISLSLEGVDPSGTYVRGSVRVIEGHPKESVPASAVPQPAAATPTVRSPAFALPVAPVESLKAPPQVAVWQPAPSETNATARQGARSNASRGARLERPVLKDPVNQ